MNNYYEKLVNRILELEKFGTKLNKSEFTKGNRFESEMGSEFNFLLFGHKYRVVISSFHQDSDDWRTAQMKIKTYCVKDDRKYKISKLFSTIKNYKNIERVIKINDILENLE
jgi:hypothetical protein